MKENKFSPNLPAMDAQEAFLHNKFKLLGPHGNFFDVPVGGAIGLLALGDVGTIAWRQKRLKIKEALAMRTQKHMTT